jgi:anti-anti-sigma regulatory factor
MTTKYDSLETHSITGGSLSHGSTEFIGHELGEWSVVVAKTRVDAFCFDQLVESVKALRQAGKIHIAIDLKTTRFMSLAAIRYCVDLGNELLVQRGRLALIAPTEKTKRHFSIYGTLNSIQIVRSAQELEGAKRPADSEL